MRPEMHMLSAVGLGAVVWHQTGVVSWTLAIASGAFLLDLDHMVDYLVHKKGRQISIQEFLMPGQPSTWQRMVFFMHGYEWIVGLGWLAWNYHLPILSWMVCGAGIHLLMDEVGNRLPGNRHRISPFFYFFCFRLNKGFQTKKISCWVNEEGQKV